MAVTLRDGIYGQYYGNDFASSNSLLVPQMEMNATYIYSALASKGWTVNAVAGMLGNMQAESSINPGRWQSDSVNWLEGGYGLVQWTPTTKYTNWVRENGYADPSEMDANLYRILWEVENNQQWIARSDYSMSFKEFSTSNLTVSELAKAFLLCYERPADQSESVQNYRVSLAEAWYEYLTGVTPIQPSSKTTRKKGYNWVLFNPRRRRII